MTMPDPAVATATRRAAAFLTHYCRSDAAGINAVLAEITDGVDMRDLLLALAGLWQATMPALVSTTGAALIENMVRDFAAVESQSP